MGVSLRGFRNQFANLSCSVKSVFQAFQNVANIFDCKIQCMPVAVCEKAFFIDIFNSCLDTRTLSRHNAGSFVTLSTATQEAETVTQNNFLKSRVKVESLYYVFHPESHIRSHGFLRELTVIIKLLR